MDQETIRTYNSRFSTFPYNFSAAEATAEFEFHSRNEAWAVPGKKSSVYLIYVKSYGTNVSNQDIFCNR